MTGHTMLLVNGPLVGRLERVIGDHFLCRLDPEPDGWQPPDVRYNIGRVVFCGRTIWVGYVGTGPRDDDLVRVLLSPAAQEAAEPGTPAGYDAHGNPPQDIWTHERQTCPDKGWCHHACPAGACFRVHHAGPLSGVYPHDSWPASIRLAYTDGGAM